MSGPGAEVANPNDIQVSVRLVDLVWVATLAHLAHAINSSGSLTPEIGRALADTVRSGGACALQVTHRVIQEHMP